MFDMRQSHISGALELHLPPSQDMRSAEKSGMDLKTELPVPNEAKAS